MRLDARAGMLRAHNKDIVAFVRVGGNKRDGGRRRKRVAVAAEGDSCGFASRCVLCDGYSVKGACVAPGFSIVVGVGVAVRIVAVVGIGFFIFFFFVVVVVVGCTFMDGRALSGFIRGGLRSAGRTARVLQYELAAARCEGCVLLSVARMLLAFTLFS